MENKYSFIIILVLSFFLSNCQINPATGEKELSLINTKEEDNIGETEHKKIIKQFGIYEALYDIVGKNALPESFGGTNDSTRQEFVEEMKSTWAVKCRKLRPIIGSSATVEKKKRHSQ